MYRGQSLHLRSDGTRVVRADTTWGGSSAIPAGSYARLWLTHVRLVEGGRYEARRSRMREEMGRVRKRAEQAQRDKEDERGWVSQSRAHDVHGTTGLRGARSWIGRDGEQRTGKVQRSTRTACEPPTQTMHEIAHTPTRRKPDARPSPSAHQSAEENTTQHTTSDHQTVDELQSRHAVKNS